MPSFRSNFVPTVNVQSEWRTSRLSMWQILAGEILPVFAYCVDQN